MIRQAADLEDSVDKHPVTPGAVLPARELLGDMLLAAERPEEALQSFETSLAISPNRLNSLYGAARVAELAQQPEKPGSIIKSYSNWIEEKPLHGQNFNRPERLSGKIECAAGSVAEVPGAPGSGALDHVFEPGSQALDFGTPSIHRLARAGELHPPDSTDLGHYHHIRR